MQDLAFCGIEIFIPAFFRKLTAKNEMQDKIKSINVKMTINLEQNTERNAIYFDLLCGRFLVTKLLVPIF